MGRNSRQTADYFPHFVGGKSRTRFILENRWGNEGYAFWFKLLELLCASEGHYYDCWPEMNWEYLLATTKVSGETAEEILGTLAGMEKIDKELWQNCRVIWVQTLLDHLITLYSKRTVTPERPSPEIFPGRKPSEKGITSAEIPGNAEKPAETAENSAETAEEKPKKRRRKPSELPADQLRLFEMFYAAYPKKVDRAIAEKAWGKITPPPDEEKTREIIGAVEQAKKYDSRFRERQYTPNPASWLNAKAWLNDYSGGEQSGNDRGDTRWNGSSGFKGSTGFRGGQ